MAMDIIKRAKEGKISQAQMNREVKAHVKTEYDKRLKQILQ
jgi:hypothetical protein